MSTAISPGVETALDAAHFESIYAKANRDRSQIPWADGRAHPALVNWLNAVAPSMVRCGSRIAVVGCGLGDDARAIMQRGYDVTAFDCSETAITWAQELDPTNRDCYFVADLFNLPARWRHRFDLVVEVNTIQALPPAMRGDAVRAMSELVSAHGHMLVVCRAAHVPVGAEDGPPWPITPDELLQAASLAGLHASDDPCVFEDDEDPPVLRMRALLERVSA